jgi:hypothetical protein
MIYLLWSDGLLTFYDYNGPLSIEDEYQRMLVAYRFASEVYHAEDLGKPILVC